ncbi:glycoside hydrolase family 55 protein [Mucisphaera calidilacus]|uniref:Pectate lyase superfamily protein n=1 Tax=Mucisphaera calidilacus TaxID=2527982 RepID=A0A518BX10_9BACT|nr:glycoside hydrolase family 55 protein [Mucisphaera calidilacus]QDU71501.1 Pectate lyase superfamily protein [Mucisphaera calidilacus]
MSTLPVPMSAEIVGAFERIREEGHPAVPYFEDQVSILNRLEGLIAGHDGRSDEPLASMEASIRPREYAVIRENLEAAIRAALREVEIGGPTVTLNVRDFGAVGDNLHDDGPALRRAVASLAEAGPGAELLLPAGTYRIDGFGGTPRRTHLLLEGLKDVTIRGEGIGRTELVGTEIGTLLRIEDCADVRVADLSLDFDPLPFTQGVIESIHPEDFSVTWRRQAGWPSPTGFPFDVGGDPTVFAVHVGAKPHCPETGRVLGHGGFTVARVEPLDEERFVLHGKKQAWETGRDLPETFRPGHPLTIQSRNVPGHQPAVWTAGNTRLTFERVAVYAAWTHTWQLTADTDVRLLGCVCEPKPGTDRLAISNADGLHIISQRVGPWIQDCRILRNFDDSSNLYCKAVSVDDQPSATELVLDSAFDPSDRSVNWQPDRRHFRVGDQLAVIDPMTGGTVGTPVITGVSERTWRGFRRVGVKLDGPLPVLRTRESLGKTHAVFSNMEFYMCAPDEPLEVMVANLQTKCDGFVMRDSVLGENSVNGIKLKASNGLVAGNHFDRNAGVAVSLLMRLTWQEAYAPRNVRMIDNTFEATHGINATVDYPGERYHYGPPYIADIEIAGNRFVNTTGFSVRLFSMRDSVVRDNQYDAAAPDVVNGEGPVIVDPSCRRVRVEDASMGEADAAGRP